MQTKVAETLSIVRLRCVGRKHKEKKKWLTVWLQWEQNVSLYCLGLITMSKKIQVWGKNGLLHREREKVTFLCAVGRITQCLSDWLVSQWKLLFLISTDIGSTQICRKGSERVRGTNGLLSRLMESGRVERVKHPSAATGERTCLLQHPGVG